MAGIIKGKDIVDGSVTSVKLDNSILQGLVNLTSEQSITGRKDFNIARVSSLRVVENNVSNIGTSTGVFNTVYANRFVGQIGASMSLSGNGLETSTVNGARITSSGDGNSYLANDGSYKAINTFSIQSIIQQVAVNLTNGTPVSVITLIPNKTGTVEVDFSCSVNATVSAVLAVLTSDAVFASLTVQFRNNGVTEYSQTCQVGRSGTTANDINYINVRRVMNVTAGISVQIYIQANEAGLSIPANANTTLLIKG